MSEAAPEFEGEAAFESHIRSKILEIDQAKQRDFVVLEAKKVADIVVVSKQDPDFCRFIEIKYYKKSSVRIGIGHKDGKGFQPEILKMQSSFFESNLIWILGSAEMPGKRWILNNSQIRKYISGGSLNSKYNSIRGKIFKEIEACSDEKMVTELKRWFGTARR